MLKKVARIFAVQYKQATISFLETTAATAKIQNIRDQDKRKVEAIIGDQPWLYPPFTGHNLTCQHANHHAAVLS